MPLRLSATIFVIACAWPATSAFAQPLGTFRWQLQPYCNAYTVNVTQQGAIYTLDGTDDRCGGGNQPASVGGLAFMTPAGLVGFGVTTVLPNGTPVHTEATINLASLSGTWRDSARNSGDFVFSPGAGTGGPPRPVPASGMAPATITNIHIANNAVTGTNIVDASLTAADMLDAPRLVADGGNLILELAATPVPVRSVSVTAPAAGQILVNASAYIQFTGAATLDLARCSITTGTSLDGAALSNASEGSTTENNYAPYSATRVFSVASGSTTTINLVCDAFSGTATLRDAHMNALFVATP